MNPPTPLLLSLRAAAALAGITPVQLDKLRKADAVFAVRLRRKHKFLRGEMLALSRDLCGFRNGALPSSPKTATKPVQ